MAAAIEQWAKTQRLPPAAIRICNREALRAAGQIRGDVLARHRPNASAREGAKPLPSRLLALLGALGAPYNDEQLAFILAPITVDAFCLVVGRRRVALILFVPVSSNRSSLGSPVEAPSEWRPDENSEHGSNEEARCSLKHSGLQYDVRQGVGGLLHQAWWYGKLTCSRVPSGFRTTKRSPSERVS